jgi:hypothetical protein
MSAAPRAAAAGLGVVWAKFQPPELTTDETGMAVHGIYSCCDYSLGFRAMIV